MKAALITDYGNDIEVTDVDRPAIPDDSVMVEVHAAAINPIDWIDDGTVTPIVDSEFPIVDSEFPIDDVAKADAHARSGEANGKVIVTMR